MAGTGSIPILFCLLFAQQLPQDRFTTGPVIDSPGTPDRSAEVLPKFLDLGAPPSPLQGTDVRTNVVTTNAQNETSVSVNPLNPLNLVAVANDYRSGNVTIGHYTSMDGGQTWVDGTFAVKPGFSFAGDPCVTFDVNGVCHILGMQYFSAAGSAVFHYRSTDGGLTWSTGTQVDLNSANDKPQVSSDYSNGPFRGALTVAWVRFSATADVWESSSADGMTWSVAQRINGTQSRNAIATDVTYGPNSELYVMWADRGTFDIWVDRSLTNGASWSADSHVSSFTQVPSPIPGSTFRMFDIFSMSADYTGGPFSGNVYVAFHTFESGDANIRCATSTDGGATWTTNLVNNDGLNRDQVMPGIIVDPNGNVNVSFFDRRLDAADFLLWTWVARSSDGGATWNNFQVSDVGWNHFPTEFGGSFIGDYLDVDASAHTVYPHWTDGRTGTQDVYTDAVHLNFYSSPSTISVATGGAVSIPINIGPNYAGLNYWMFASLSGTTPGVNIGGVHLNLNWDFFSTFSLQFANSAIFPNSRGILDGTGSATTGFDTLGPVDPVAIGVPVDFATLVLSGPPVFGTNATRVTFVP